MPIPPTLARHLQQTVKVELFKGYLAGRGKPEFHDPVTYKARIVHRAVVVGKGADGKDIVSHTQVTLDRLVTIDPKSRITLPNSPVKPPIIHVEEHPAGAGGTLGHTRILL